MNTTKEKCLIIEDSDKGIQSAISSGCKYIKVKNQEDVTIDLFKGYI